MDLKILKVTNLIPVKIDYAVDGKEKSTYAYIDYVTQVVSGAEDIPQELVSEFKKSVKSFISKPSLEFDIPKDVYKQQEKAGSFNINDFMTEDLTVQLKR